MESIIIVLFLFFPMEGSGIAHMLYSLGYPFQGLNSNLFVHISRLPRLVAQMRQYQTERWCWEGKTFVQIYVVAVKR